MIKPYYFAGLSEYIYVLYFSSFLFHKLIHQFTLKFFTFLSFHSCLLHICTAWAMSSLIASSISISVDQNRLKAVWGETKKNELEGHE